MLSSDIFLTGNAACVCIYLGTAKKYEFFTFKYALPACYLYNISTITEQKKINISNTTHLEIINIQISFKFNWTFKFKLVVLQVTLTVGYGTVTGCTVGATPSVHSRYCVGRPLQSCAAGGSLGHSRRSPRYSPIYVIVFTRTWSFSWWSWSTYGYYIISYFDTPAKCIVLKKN